MKKMLSKTGALVILLVFACVLLAGAPAQATIQGETGTSFSFAAHEGYISTSDGDSMLMWGYGLESSGAMQYPGPTLILNKGATVTITLKNMLPAARNQNVSLVFPGHAVTATGGVAGIVTREAPPDGTTAVTYTFTASNPGTYLYHSGTRMDLQIEMGLVGAIIVRSGLAPVAKPPIGIYEQADTQFAYDHVDTAYEREYLFLLTDMDPDIHRLVEYGNISQVNTSTFFATNWFINGRNAPDDMAEPNVPWLPNQPYNCMPLMHPGERTLARVICAGRDLHPFHFHGNDIRVISRDGRLLSSNPPTAGPDLAYYDYTVMAVPGQTYDGIFEWTGEKIGFDVYGHAPGDALMPYEDATDHGNAFPTNLPPIAVLNLGQFWNGSPFLGATGDLPPGFVGLNAAGGYAFMWHSHSEKELTSNNIFPGGMLTMMLVLPWGVAIP